MLVMTIDFQRWWGSSIAHPNEFLAQLTADLTIGGKFETDFTAQDVLRLSANGALLMITASLLRVVYATMSTRMETRHPSFKVVHTGGVKSSKARLLSEKICKNIKNMLKFDCKKKYQE